MFCAGGHPLPDLFDEDARRGTRRMEQNVSVLGGVTGDALEPSMMQPPKRGKPVLERRSKRTGGRETNGLLAPAANRILPLRLCRIHQRDDGLDRHLSGRVNFV
jgi:hypothetical protein